MNNDQQARYKILEVYIVVDTENEYIETYCSTYKFQCENWITNELLKKCKETTGVTI